MDPEDAALKVNVETLDDKIQATGGICGPRADHGVMYIYIYTVYRERVE